MRSHRSLPCRLLLVLLLAGGTLAAAACTRNDKLPPLPDGPQILTGTLLPTDLSLLRRGTHVLRMDNVDTYYVESTLENLRKYEQKRVVLEGTLSRNSDPTFLPVLDVTRVMDVLDEAVKNWTSPALHLSLQSPESWEGHTESGALLFTAPGGSGAVVTIASYEKPPMDVRDGVPLVVANVRALRTIDEQTGNQFVLLEQRGAYLLFSFMPGDHADQMTLRADFLALLTSVSFEKERAPSSSVPSIGTGATVGTPCGGTAGILCPEGLYCDIQNLQENIGVCKRL